MTCKRCLALLSELAGGELVGRAADDARMHLENCVSCARAFRETRDTVAWGMPVVAASSEMERASPE